LNFMQPLDWYVQMLVIGQPVTVAFAIWLQRRRGDANALGEKARTDSIVPGLLGVRPEEVVCLQMEDHYVRVHTRKGSRMVLATFGQAMEAVANCDGLRVHRSWWAARDALASATWQGRNLRLILVTGIAVPVARSSIADLRAAGWLSSAAP
jgi:DNA-binding LytR/AlgR family response regulator